MGNPLPYTPAELERLRTAAYRLVMDTPGLVGIQPGGDPMLIVAALSMALAHVAILTRTPYDEVLLLLGYHHEAALIGDALSELEGPGVIVLNRPEGNS